MSKGPISQFIEKNYLKIIDDGLFGESYDVEKGFYFKNKFLRRILNKKKDIIKIIGYIEEARRDLQLGVNTAYSLKNMILKIGG